jgi:ketosteroid isomerase-like protein
MTKVLGLGIALAIGSTAFAKGGAEWDTKAAAEVKPLIEKFFADFQKLDAAAMKGAIADDAWGMWDLDMAQQPGSWGNKAEIDKFFDEATGMMKKAGATMTWKTTKLDCKASGALAVCLLEGDQTINMPKMPPMSMTARGTEVFAKEKSGWKWVHHHGSVSKDGMPSKFMATSGKAAAGWMDAPPNLPGAKIMPVWMDPANMWSTSLLKATQLVKEARHMHPYPFTTVILEGSMITTDETGKDHEYGPGSVIYRAPGEAHASTLKPGLVAFSVNAGPMMTIPVDDKGQPIKQAQK